MDNSIEVFNCPLCSFCETGLDRLVKHIRHHIKPEPTQPTIGDQPPATIDSPILPRDYGEVNQQKERLDSYINNLSSSKEPSPANKLLSTSDKRDIVNGEEGDKTSSKVVPEKNTDHAVTTKEKVKPSTDSLHQQPHIQLTSLSSSLPHVLNSELTKPMHVSPPHANHPSTHSMVYVRNESPKYVKIHPSPYGNHHQPQPPQPAQPPQYKQFHHAEQFIPISPVVNPNNFHAEGKVVPMDIHHEPYHRPPHNANQYMPQQQQQHSSRASKNSRSQMEKLSTYQLPPNYHPAPHQHYLARPPQHQTPFQQQNQQQQQKQYHHQQKQKQQLQQHNFQPRIDNARHNLNMPNVGFPNNGYVYTNPEQMQNLIGNSAPIDQLAGLLVIPLKKTSEISVQTDPVTFEDQSNKRTKSQSSTSCSVQTDLKMQHISEEHHHLPASVFDQIRSTDSLHECLICGDEFVGNSQLQNHMRTSHQHVCDNCFHASTSLQEHTHHITECGKCDAELLCMDCNSSFASVKKLNQHRIKIHDVRMPFRCGICNQPFESHDAVMDHMSAHDNNLPEFKCRYCTKIFQSADGLNKHFQRHKQVKVEHQCRFCQMSFNTDRLLRDHIGIAHVIREDEKEDLSINSHKIEVVRRPPVTSFSGIPNNINANRKYFLCRYCDLAFKNKELLSKHVKMCSKNGSSSVTTFVCDVCKEFFGSDEARKTHLKNDHRRQNGYRCPKCSKVYRTWTRLKFHTKQQHLKKNCPDCTSVFTKEHILRKHQEDVHGKSTSQNGDRIYKCSDCSLTLYTLTDLTMHRRTVHPNHVKPNKSAELSSNATMLSFIDNQSNNINSTMEEASNVAQDENKEKNGIGESRNKAFACERCNSTFDSSKRLKNHLGLTHGERPFVCELCNKHFQYSSQIVWHMKNHQNRSSGAKTSSKLWKPKSSGSKFTSKGLGNHVCQFCGAQFKQEKLLKNHKGVVHKIKLFSCYICAAKYGHSTELIWHERTCKAKFIRENPGTDLPEKLADDSSAFQQSDEPETDTMDDCDENEHHEEESSMNDHTEEDVDEEMDLHATNIQLSKEEADELLQNDPEYDHARGEYTCPLCRKTTKSITGMKTHYGRVHGIWGKESSHKYANGQKVTIWPCRSCDEEFQSFESIQSHCLEEHGMSVTKEDLDFETRQEIVPSQSPSSKSVALYTCQSCGVSFDNSKSIRVHTFKKHGIILNDVALNESKNSSNVSMENGSSPSFTAKKEPSSDVVEDELRYKCQNCTSQFRSTKAIRVHSYKRHGTILAKGDINRSKIWVAAADVINPPNANLSNLPSKGRDLVETPNPCDRCGRVFGNYRALFTHYRQAHRISDPNHIFVPRKPSRTELSIQSQATGNDEELKDSNDSLYSPRSSNSSTPNTNIKQQPEMADSVDCPKCGRTFTNHKSFVAHLYSAHKVSKDQYSIYWPNGIPILPRESSTCPSCNKECLDERAMRIHMFKAHGTHYRDYCQDQGSNKSDSLASPDGMVTMVNETNFSGMNVSNEDIGLTCYACSKLCKSRKSLTAHEFAAHGIRREGGNRLFPSDFKMKGRDFHNDDFSAMSMVGNANNRMASNNNTSTPNNGDVDKPFTCSICEASYHNRRAITTHLCRVHKYKKDDVKGYFDQYYADDVTMTSYVDDVNHTSSLIGGADEEAEITNGLHELNDVTSPGEPPKVDIIPNDVDDDDNESTGMVIDEGDEVVDGNSDGTEKIVQVLQDDYVGSISNDDIISGGLENNIDLDKSVLSNPLTVDATA